MSSAINPKGARVYAADATPFAWVETYLGSSVGSKILVAITGLLLSGFVVFHMIGNLKMFHGPDSINAYAHFLKHDLGALIWIARGGLLLIFVVHLGKALALKIKTSSARPIGYACEKSAQATVQSKSMLSTGMVIGLFVLFHLAHFTFAWVHDADQGNGVRVNYLAMRDSHDRHDVYRMVIAGFSTPWIAALYLLAQGALFAHLTHGISSSLQTLGLVGRRFTQAAVALAYAVALTILVGNTALVVSVWVGYVR